MNEGRVCDVAGCSGKVLYSARRDGSEFCAGCGVVYNPPMPTPRPVKGKPVDLLGPHNYEGLRSAADYGARPL